MNVRLFFTKPRSRERALFGTLGWFFVAFGLFQVVRGNWGVAAFLASSGVAMVLAAWLCSERTLVATGIAAVLVNVAAAAFALVTGAGV